ncbi:MAG: hypothetical protein E7642_08900 [Ruminococcaceae bacterium]|nr:hypothetical protein [Oscillospiraceae bacterium]
MVHLIPTPTKNELKDERRIFPANYSIPAELDSAADTLCDFAKRIHGVAFSEGDGGISLTLDGSLDAEVYTLDVSESGICVCAADLRGAQNAVATLIQLMKKEDGGISLPLGTLFDRPECSWRGVMIDLARNWHDVSMLYEYIDMCRFYKVKYLHLHFTDDQSYTLPSKAFPKLSTVGRCYSTEQIKDVIAYAKKRGIEIVPEVDAPGHTACFNAAYGEIFGTNGIICQSDESMKGMEAVYRELCELFEDSQYVHIGGDEAYNIPKWTTCPKCMDVYRRMGHDVDSMEKRELEELMYATFLKKVCDIILSCGKTPVMWEGFAKEVNHVIPKQAVIMSWENLYQTTPSLLEGGFRLVNCSWVPMYVLAPDKYWSPREIYEWNVYYWKPCHPRSPYINSHINVEPTEQIEGGELLAWGDHIIWSYPDNIEKGVREEQRLVEERVPCLAENVWNRTKKCSDHVFFAAYTNAMRLHKKLRESKE